MSVYAFSMGSAADKIIDLYRKHALSWDARRGAQFAEKAWLEKFRRHLTQRANVLDLGCGSGNPIARFLADEGCSVTGVDASSELLNIAEKRIASANWICADIRELKLDWRFDGIVAWNSTFHLTPDDQRLMFPVFQKHIAVDGILIFTSGPAEGEVVGDFEGEPLYHSSLSQAEYKSLLAEHGFRLLEYVVEDPNCNYQTIWLAQYVEEATR